jgi:hypothetical protein
MLSPQARVPASPLRHAALLLGTDARHKRLTMSKAESARLALPICKFKEPTRLAAQAQANEREQLTGTNLSMGKTSGCKA